MSAEKIRDQPIFWNSHTKLDFSSDNPYIYCIPSRNISDKFIIIRDLCRFLQPGLISYSTFDEKLGLLTVNHKIIYKIIMEFIVSNWKHLFRIENSQKALSNFFYYNNKGTTKVKDFQKLRNKEIYFAFQSNSTK